MTKKLRMILAVFFLGLLAVGGCARAQKDDGDEVYQEAHSKIQKKFSSYVVENYTGVKKIEWQGINIERYDSPSHGRSLFGDVTTSIAYVYVTDEQYTKVIFFLSDLATFDQEKKQFVLDDRTILSEFDDLIDLGLINSKDKLSKEEYEPFETLKKGSGGSSGVAVKYNVTMHEVK